MPRWLTQARHAQPSAATRGDVVFTSEVDDLERLRVRFPSVRLLGW
jgi:hypothetical protein